MASFFFCSAKFAKATVKRGSLVGSLYYFFTDFFFTLGSV